MGDEENAEIYESRDWCHARRHHGQEKPEARSQTGSKRASCSRGQGKEASEGGEEGEESRAEGSNEGSEAQGWQGRRRKTLIQATTTTMRSARIFHLCFRPSH